eukprot:11261604-Alexandrium_andersonii.AAC.1
MRQPSADPRNAWTRDLTEDGDVEDNPGPRFTAAARRRRGRARALNLSDGTATNVPMDHLRPGSGLLQGPEGTTG